MGRGILTATPPLYDHKIAYGGGEFHFGYLRVPKSKGPHPVAVVIHGGFWRAAYNLEHSGHMCAALTASGIATWSLEYRRIGNPGGGWPGTFDDVVAGASHVAKIAAQHSLDAGRLTAVGHSAGGHLALLLASDARVRLRSVIALAPVTDLKQAWESRLSNTVVAELMGGSPFDKPDAYAIASPIVRLVNNCPARLIHGSADEVVPVEQSRRYIQATATSKRDAALVEIPKADHFDLIDPSSLAWRHVERAILELL